MLNALSISMSILALVLAICVLIVTILITRIIKNGSSIHLLTAALVYAVIVRIIIAANALAWTNIPTTALGPPTYLLLLLGFWSLYRAIVNLGKEKKKKSWFKFWEKGGG